jgi:glyoxylase-like metal-dependent hydrolase (beta-lactamase superfamily II)
MHLDLSLKKSVHSKRVQQFFTKKGALIFQLPMEVFPDFWAYAYLIQYENYLVLIDTGSGYGVSNQHLQENLRNVGITTNRIPIFKHLTHVFITHGHIDHFGGLPFVREQSKAIVGVHELDMRNVTNTEERLEIVSRRLDEFLLEAGIESDERTFLNQLYKMTKLDYSSVPIDFTYEAIGMKEGPFEFIHVPGHCPGQVVIKIHDVIFSGDHILADISPHQSPERLVLNTGLEHYLHSLDILKNNSVDIALTLGGHNSPILDLSKRIDEIKRTHAERLDKILRFMDNPRTISEVSDFLFSNVSGYNLLLALEETGAHIEYLYQRGFIGIANLNSFSRKNQSPILYQRL